MHPKLLCFLHVWAYSTVRNTITKIWWDRDTQGTPIFSHFSCAGNQEVFPELEERESALKDARLSFPSGHASFSFQTSVFIVLYLQVRMGSQ